MLCSAMPCPSDCRRLFPYICVCVRVSLVVARLAEGIAQPFETLVETISGCGAGRLDVLEHY